MVFALINNPRRAVKWKCRAFRWARGRKCGLFMVVMCNIVTVHATWIWCHVIPTFLSRGNHARRRFGLLRTWMMMVSLRSLPDKQKPSFISFWHGKSKMFFERKNRNIEAKLKKLQIWEVSVASRRVCWTDFLLGMEHWKMSLEFWNLTSFETLLLSSNFLLTIRADLQPIVTDVIRIQLGINSASYRVCLLLTVYFSGPFWFRLHCVTQDLFDKFNYTQKISFVTVV
jgi:hypothetical protein